MSIFDRKPALRWVTPLAFVAVVGGTTGIVATASAGPDLPHISPQQLLVKVQQADVATLSGTVVQKSNLGLPSLPGMSGSDDTSLTSLATGSHTIRVWKSGDTKSRLQVQGQNNESDVVVNGKDLWTWSYKGNKATHTTLTAPAGSAAKARQKAAPAPTDVPKTPQDAAKQVLAALDKTTTVRIDGTGKVAGVPAYEMVLTPKADGKTLIDQVRIAVDAKSYLPLGVQVMAGRAKPTTILDVSYSTISFDRPSDAQFSFNPPKGAKVTEVSPQAKKPLAGPGTKAPTPKQLKARQAEAAARTKVVGSGWSTVVVTKLDAKASDQITGQLGTMLKSLPAAKGGGRLLSATGFSAVLTDDGRLAVGAVTPDALYSALGK